MLCSLIMHICLLGSTGLVALPWHRVLPWQREEEAEGARATEVNMMLMLRCYKGGKSSTFKTFLKIFKQNSRTHPYMYGCNPYTLSVHALRAA